MRGRQRQRVGRMFSSRETFYSLLAGQMRLIAIKHKEISTMNYLALLKHDLEHGVQSKGSPTHLQRLLQDWPGAETDNKAYSFGTVVNQLAKDDTYVNYLFRIFSLGRAETFSYRLEEPGPYLLVCLKRPVKIEIKGFNLLMDEHSCGIVYLPAGELTWKIREGLSAMLVIGMHGLIDHFKHNEKVERFIAAYTEQPYDAISMHSLNMHVWLLSALNLVLNFRRDPRLKSETLSGLLTHVIKIYLNSPMGGGILSDLSDQLHLHELTGRPVATPLYYGLAEHAELYQEIVEYLKNHLKDNYTRKQIAEKRELPGIKFGQIFKEGYGKPFKEGYVEIKMIQALEWITQKKKLAEVAEATGYTSVAKFTMEFRNFYYYPPALFQWPYLGNTYREDHELKMAECNR